MFYFLQLYKTVFMIDPYSKGLDKWVKEALDNPKFSKVISNLSKNKYSSYTVNLNGKLFWVANGHHGLSLVDPLLPSIRPSRLMVCKFMQEYNKFINESESDIDIYKTLTGEQNV